MTDIDAVIAQTVVPTWDDYHMGMAISAARRSKDRSTKLGCVIVGPDNEIRTTGYNSFPRGIRDDIEERHQRPEKYDWTEHAERNAIYNAARHGVALKDCKLYVPWLPCMPCARGIINVGITTVIGYATRLDDPTFARDFPRVRQMFKEAGVQLLIMPHLPE